MSAVIVYAAQTLVMLLILGGCVLRWYGRMTRGELILAAAGLEAVSAPVGLAGGAWLTAVPHAVACALWATMFAVYCMMQRQSCRSHREKRNER